MATSFINQLHFEMTPSIRAQPEQHGNSSFNLLWDHLICKTGGGVLVLLCRMPLAKYLWLYLHRNMCSGTERLHWIVAQVSFVFISLLGDLLYADAVTSFSFIWPASE